MKYTYNQNAHAWIATADGKELFYESPLSGMSIENIARGLSNNCRWSGQLNMFYSIAQHSVLVSLIGPLPLRKLFHDGSEAFTGDVNKPLKNLLGATFKDIEDRLQLSVWDFLGLGPMTPEEKKEVKRCDMAVSLAEARELQGNIVEAEGFEAAKISITPWTSERSYFEFMNRYRAIIGGHHEAVDMWPR